MTIASESAARAYVSVRCTAAILAKLDRFAVALAAASREQNLVSRASLENVWQRHIADSAQLLELAPSNPSPWLDLGSGAGLPGLVIAAMRDDCEVVMVESRRLRVQWLERMIADLECRNCRVEAKDLAKVPGFPARVISARAFAPLDRLIAQSARFSTNNTMWLLPKGRSAAQEVAALPAQLRRMFHVEPSQTDAAAGIVTGQGKAELNG